MGLFFELFVETNGSLESNKHLNNYFLSIGMLKVSDVLCKISVRSNNIGVIVSILETGHTGLSSDEERTFATDVGFAFYELLKKAPRFRYAMVGVEAGEWSDAQDILSQSFDGYLPNHGIVINDNLKINFDNEFISFKKGYSWLPYKGEVESG